MHRTDGQIAAVNTSSVIRDAGTATIPKSHQNFARAVTLVAVVFLAALAPLQLSWNWDWDIILEAIRIPIMGLTLCYLLWIGSAKGLRRQPGWTHIVAGFSLIFIGSIVDLTDNFESLNRYVVIGDTVYEAFVEKVVGYLAGFILLSIGFWLWLPLVGSLRKAEEDLRLQNRELQDARARASTDELTGLSNHRAFHERVQAEAPRAQESGRPVGLIMLDVDNFKRINDSRGHRAGDDVLRQLAAVLVDVAGQGNAYRYGGNEFAILLPGTDHETTLTLAERLRRALENRSGGDSVTVSLGVASFPTVESVEELVYGADVAMYWAKSEGKNRVGDWARLVGGRTDGILPWFAADGAVHAPEVVTALGEALAAKDPSTKAHTERCSSWAAKVTQELGLGEAEASTVRLASLLHDVGKLAVPDEILLKPGPLSEEEWGHMKRHSTAGLQMLGKIRSLTNVTPSILHHHEHFDGSGYPDGLVGEEIPIASRILLVTDAFDAMTNDRPYRKAMPVKAAIDELIQHKGSQFDAAVVDAFLRVLTREGNQPQRRTEIPVTDTV